MEILALRSKKVLTAGKCPAIILITDKQTAIQVQR
jgi:hypothetical protein